MYKTLSSPFVVQVEITENCTNNCVHCYNYWRHATFQKEALLQLDAFQINKIMDELERAKVFEVVVTGGEPLLNKSGLFQILDRVESSDFMFSAINSNLLNLNIFDAQRLAGYQRLGRILTSLMGPSEEIHDTISGSHGSFNQTIKGIELLKSCGVAISVNMVVSKLNKEYVQATAQLCKELRVKTFNATRATTPLNCPDFSPYALSLNELREYLRALSEAGKQFELPVGALNVYPMCAVKHLRETSS